MTISKGFLNAHKLGRKLVKENNFKDGICAFGVVSATKDDFDERKAAPCHAALTRMEVKGEYKYMVDAMYPHGDELTPHMAKTYARYILKKSPYSPMFAEKNIEKGWARGYFLYNVDVDANLLTGGAVAIRMLSESPRIPLMWNKLVDAGANPDIALLMAHMSGITDEGQIYLNKYNEEGHVAMVPSWFDRDSVANFATGNLRKFGLYNKRKRYGGFNGMWFEGGEIRKNYNFSMEMYDQFTDAVKDMGGEVDKRVALFHHAYNWAKEDQHGLVNEKKGMVVLAKLINNYLEEALNA